VRPFQGRFDCYAYSSGFAGAITLVTFSDKTPYVNRTWRIKTSPSGRLADKNEKNGKFADYGDFQLRVTAAKQFRVQTNLLFEL
jgi:hypothetical protein